MAKHVPLLLLISVLVASLMPVSTSTNIVRQTETQSNFVFQTGGNQTTPKYGGTLRIGLGIMPATLNPLIDWNSIYVGSEFIWLNIFSSLVRTDENGSFIPNLAKNWTISEDGRSFTFYLYENVTWHDGIEFGATDVKFTYDTILSDPAITNFWKNDIWGGPKISSVEISNSTTVVFNLENPHTSFLPSVSWTPILPFHLYNGTDISTNPYNDEPVGTGPFKFASWTLGHNITLMVNELYSRGRPYIDTLFFQKLGYRERPQYLMNNLIDIAPISTDTEAIKDLITIPGISIFIQDSTFLQTIGINLSRPILSDRKVRKALSYAINRTGMCEIVFSQYGIPATGPISPSLDDWYNPNVTTYGFNQTISEQLLNESGNLRDPETGIRFNVTLKVLGGSPWQETGEIVKSYFEDIGIGVTLQTIWAPEWFSLEDFELALGGFALDAHLKWQYDLWHSGGEFNHWNFNNGTVDSLLEEAQSTYNQTIRRLKYFELQEILAEELPNIFVSYRKMVTAYNNDFHGFSESNYVYSLHSYSLEKVWYDSTLSGQGKSPVKVCFVDSEGRRTGFFNGSIVEQIANSTYDEEFNVVKIRSPSGNYTVEVTGTDNGTYSLELVNIALDYKHTEIPLNTIHNNQTRTYLVQVFPDGKMKVWDPLLDITGPNGVPDWKINIRDIAAVARAFGSFPGWPNWNEAADVHEDEKVNMRDIAMVARQFGKKWP